MSHDARISGTARTEIAESDPKKVLIQEEHAKGSHGREIWDHEHNGNFGSSQPWI